MSITDSFYPIFKEKWGKFQTFHIISDTHFNDSELKSGIERPTEEEIVRMINSKVGKNDLLFVLGDVGDLTFARQLKGYKVLVMGNHDAGHTNYEEVFDEVYGGPVMIAEKLILSHEPIAGITWAFNIHGHAHDKKHKNDKYHFNVCADVINYTPINFNQWMKEGHFSKVESIHRTTIDKATKRKNGRLNKKF